ncbi:tryptophan-rich sensory protein [Xanthomonas hortorum pv. vitians]|nr:tryptophan-rich sensory protein [Xanthomonas hortorum pv. vitians]
MACSHSLALYGDVDDEEIAVVWTAGVVGAVLSGRCPGSDGVDRGGELLRRVAAAGLGAPGWLFGPVWTVLYGMMAVSAWLVWRRGGWNSTHGALSLFVLQLGLNGLWSWLFFAWHMGAWAFVDIVALWVALVLTIVAFAKWQRVAAWLLVPYLLWVSLAAALNYSVWQLNPQVLG